MEPREDRLRVEGEFPDGWLYVSLPRFPGWEIWLENSMGTRRMTSLPALEAFQKIEVPPGNARMHFIYNPASWRLGMLLTLAALAALAVSWRRPVT